MPFGRDADVASQNFVKASDPGIRLNGQFNSLVAKFHLKTGNDATACLKHTLDHREAILLGKDMTNILNWSTETLVRVVPIRAIVGPLRMRD